MLNRTRSRFEAWLKTDAGPAPAQERESQYRQGLGEKPDFVDDTQRTIEAGIAVSRTFDFPGRTRLELRGDGRDRLHVGDLHFMAQAGIKLENMRVNHIFFVSAAGVVLRNVFVRTIDAVNAHDFLFENCWIGELQVRGEGIVDLQARGGGIYAIKSDNPDAHRFRGSIHFERSVYFPRTIKDAPGRVQSYRDMRANMLTLQNTPMVNLFHTLEQATERRLDRLGFQRFVSWLYERLSDYGASTLRPLGWFIVLLVVTTALAYADGVEPVAVQDFRGWQTVLAGAGRWATLNRAFTLMVQSTLNPLSIFGGRGLLVPHTSLLAAWLLFHGVATAILVALFILAIRRRFKMQ